MKQIVTMLLRGWFLLNAVAVLKDQRAVRKAARKAARNKPVVLLTVKVEGPRILL